MLFTSLSEFSGFQKPLAFRLWCVVPINILATRYGRHLFLCVSKLPSSSWKKNTAILSCENEETLIITATNPRRIHNRPMYNLLAPSMERKRRHVVLHLEKQSYWYSCVNLRLSTPAWAGHSGYYYIIFKCNREPEMVSGRTRVVRGLLPIATSTPSWSPLGSSTGACSTRLKLLLLLYRRLPRFSAFTFSEYRNQPCGRTSSSYLFQ